MSLTDHDDAENKNDLRLDPTHKHAAAFLKIHPECGLKIHPEYSSN
jgi:hypothetical protein